MLSSNCFKPVPPSDKYRVIHSKHLNHLSGSNAILQPNSRPSPVQFPQFSLWGYVARVHYFVNMFICKDNVMNTLQGRNPVQACASQDFTLANADKFENLPLFSQKAHSLPVLCFLLFVGCLASQQHASVSQGRICSDNSMCCHTETEVADQTFYLTQSQYTDTGTTSPSTDPIMPGACQGSHWNANFYVTGMTWPWKNPGASGIWTWDLPLSRRAP